MAGCPAIDSSLNYATSMAHQFMLPSDPWDYGSPGGQPTSSRDESRAASASRISIDHLAVLLSAKDEGTPAELTRDLQLNDIVKQACLATGATGAAIALARGDDLICRASTGKTAPDLGVRLNTAHGLSAFCVHTRETQRCDDSDFDPRVDAAVCRQLGVRSVLVIPMIYGDFLLGIFEIFSPHSFAFHDRDGETLLALSRSVLIALGISTMPEEPEAAAPEPLAPPVPVAPTRFHFSDLLAAERDQLTEEPGPVNDRWRDEAVHPKITAVPVARHQVQAETSASVPAEQSSPQFKMVQPARDYWTGILTFLVVALALVLGWMLGHGHSARKNAAREELRAAVATQGENTSATPQAEHTDLEGTIELPSPPSAAKRERAKADPVGLVVYQDGKIIFRQVTPSRAKADKSAPANPVELAPDVAGALLTRRIEPHYPERARRQNVQGAVILQALVNEEGGVQQLKVLVGNADLAVAAIDAVRHWRFKPYALKGRASQFETRITVNFALPGAQQIND
jgi:TonB family protein